MAEQQLESCLRRMSQISGGGFDQPGARDGRYTKERMYDATTASLGGHRPEATIYWNMEG